jgi:diguanylate cyclase (GGDEF)-like protein
MNVAADVRSSRRLLAYTACALYALAGIGGLIDSMTPGGSRVDVLPSVLALVLAAGVAAVGPRLPRLAMAPLGPIGIAFLAYALVSSPDIGDTAALLVLPVLWTAFFFRVPGVITIVALTGLAYALTLISLPPSSDYVDHWIDVMVAVSAVAAVITVLGRRNDDLLARVAGEARTDALTGLLNRRGFDERAAIELAHSRREYTSVAVAVFDLDYFKRINDEWGHETGDRVLARMGRVLAANAREIDAVARVGGEEFAVLLPNADTTVAENYAARVRRALALTDPALPPVGFSAGVAADTGPERIDTLVQHADTALYAAKRAGRGRTSVHRGTAEPLVAR